METTSQQLRIEQNKTLIEELIIPSVIALEKTLGPHREAAVFELMISS